MCELVEPEHYDPAWKRWSFDSLPMVPAAFALQVREGAREHWALLSKLIQQRGLDEVVNACDAGREGELIFRYVWEAAGGKARVSRLWLASLTEGAIKGAWAARKPAAAYDALGDAARCRSEADWLVGLNATRAMTCLARSAGGDQLLSVGRVQTPTLAMIVGRDREIADFVPEDFWRVEATLLIERVIEGVIEGGIDGQAEGGRLRARWFRHDLQEQPPEGGQARLAEGAEGEEDALPIERLPSAILAHTLVEALREQRAVVLSSERKEKREAPPLLYDLTSLQRRANQRYGLSADRTLELAQSLYEARLITYPRTDARYITPDQVAELPPVVQGLAHLPPYTAAARAILARPIQPGRRVVNADEVGDHHAILPTAARPDPGGLQPDQKRIYDLIARRLLAALSPDAIFDLTALVVEVPAARAPAPLPSPPRLRARGRVCRERGWQAIDPPAASKDRELPLLTVGGRAQVVDPAVLAGATRPPRPHTEASLLYQMETAGKALDDDELKRALRAGGLGTPATRAAIIETLLKRGFIERRGKELHALGRGVALIAALPVEELKSPALTGRWEARLHHVAEGKESRARFMADVRERLGAMVGEMKGATPPAPERQAAEGPSLGPCPTCGQPVSERRGRYACAGTCGFVVWATMAKRDVSARMVKQLLKERQTPVVKGWKSKAGKAFEAGLKLDAENKVVFSFADGDRPRRAPPDPEGLPCPACEGGKVIVGRSAWGCSRWKEGCAWRMPFVEDGLPVDPEAAAKEIFNRGPVKAEATPTKGRPKA
jgi:DNA topoisomerase-3